MHHEKNHTITFVILLIVLAIIVFLGVGGLTLWYFLKNEQDIQEESTKIDITAEGWESYSNLRYNFSAKYPVSFEKFESDNGDGATFTSASPRITVSVYAQANGNNQTVSETLDALAADLKKETIDFREISKKDTQIQGNVGEERIWQYKDAIEDADTVHRQITILNNNNFYTVQMTIYYTDYEEYKNIFDEFAGSLNFN